MKPVLQSRGLSLTRAHQCRPSFRPPGHWSSGLRGFLRPPGRVALTVSAGSSGPFLSGAQGHVESSSLDQTGAFGRRPWRQGLLITPHHGHVVSAQVVPGGIDRSLAAVSLLSFCFLRQSCSGLSSTSKRGKFLTVEKVLILYNLLRTS